MIKRSLKIPFISNKTLSLLMAMTLGVSASLAQAEAQLQVQSGEYKAAIVELYTSEGCSSCPPADEWLSKLGEIRDPAFNVIPLAFHVDYWNYLGWKDPFSSSQYTKRQRFLGQLNRQSNIYTPEFLVDNRETRGANALISEVKRNNKQQPEAKLVVDLTNTGGDDWVANIDVDNFSGDNATLYLAVYENNIDREIGGGENRGRSLHHDHVVRYMSKPINCPDGVSEQRLRFAIDQQWKSADVGIAIWVVHEQQRKTLQALEITPQQLTSVL